MTVASLDGVLELEAAIYPFPWTRGNFVDSLVAGYLAWTLNHVDGDLVGYFVAMTGVGEMHLLNITVAPAARRRGHARRMLAELVRHVPVRARRARLWLEVRESNDDAREVYRRLGFAQVGRRKGYYPAPDGRREDAVVMSMDVADGDAPMRWTERQRAMLREMGVRLWLPDDAQTPARGAPSVACATVAVARRRAPRPSPQLGGSDAAQRPPRRRATRRACATGARPRTGGLARRRRSARCRRRRRQQQLLENMLRAIGVGLVAPDARAPRRLLCASGHCRTERLAADARCSLRRSTTVAPRCVLAFGRAAAAALLGADAPLGGLRGRVHAHAGVPVVVTFSDRVPAAPSGGEGEGVGRPVPCGARAPALSRDAPRARRASALDRPLPAAQRSSAARARSSARRPARPWRSSSRRRSSRRRRSRPARRARSCCRCARRRRSSCGACWRRRSSR